MPYETYEEYHDANDWDDDAEDWADYNRSHCGPEVEEDNEGIPDDDEDDE